MDSQDVSRIVSSLIIPRADDYAWMLLGDADHAPYVMLVGIVRAARIMAEALRTEGRAEFCAVADSLERIADEYEQRGEIVGLVSIQSGGATCQTSAG